MVSVEELKNYLYIPYEDPSDDFMLRQFIEVAYTYLSNATENFDILYKEVKDAGFIKQADLFVTLYSSELYNSRNLYFGRGSDYAEPSFVTKALILQLQTYTVPESYYESLEASDEEEGTSDETISTSGNTHIDTSVPGVLKVKHPSCNSDVVIFGDVNQ